MLMLMATLSATPHIGTIDNDPAIIKGAKDRLVFFSGLVSFLGITASTS
jgi:hypothetical protein